MTAQAIQPDSITPRVPERWGSAATIAAFYGVTPKTVWEWARSGRIPKGRKVGANSTRWWMPAVDAALEG